MHRVGMFSGAGLVNSAIDPEGRFFIDRDPKVCLHNPPRAHFHKTFPNSNKSDTLVEITCKKFMSYHARDMLPVSCL